MRTFRLALGAAVISSLLLCASVVTAAAADPIPGGAADRVSGQLIVPEHIYGPEPAPGLPGVMASKWQYEVAWDSDIQLPRHVTLVMREDLHFMSGPERAAVVCWGNIAIEDSNGYLAGPVRGFAIDGDAQVQAMLTGGGAYEGVNAILTGPIGGEEGGTIEGLVFEGYMPQDRFVSSSR
ncbi:MAG: hypothetical protein PVG27_08760 [Chloroflexota bacterium]|jgi:hypothetical protein